jgi:hypothetical protein
MAVWLLCSVRLASSESVPGLYGHHFVSACVKTGKTCRFEIRVGIRS